MQKTLQMFIGRMDNAGIKVKCTKMQLPKSPCSKCDFLIR